MATGRQIAYKISEKRDEIQRQARILNDQITRQERELASVIQEQSKLLQQLASIHLSEDIPLPKNIESLMNSRTKKIDEAKERIKVSEKEMNDLREKRKVLSETTTKAFEAYDVANKEAHTIYEADENATRLRNHLQTVDDTLLSLRGKLDRANAELAEKRVAYEEDPYFCYLIKRGYDTEEYTSFGFTKRMDTWLANKIAFNRKKSDLETLFAIPQWVVNRIDTFTVENKGYRAELENIFNSIHTEANELKTVLDQSNNELKALDNNISKLRVEVREASEYISEAALATDQDLHKITKTYAEQLAKLGASNLHSLVSKTASKEDDKLVDRITALEVSRNTINNLIQKSMPGKQTFERRIQAMDEVERKLKSRGWSGSSDKFSNKAEQEIDNLASGVITAVVMWDLINRSHRPDTDQYSSRSSSGSSWGSSSSSGSSSSWGSSSSDSGSSGGFGGGSWSSGGGFGGDDSSSGGGF